MRAFAENGADRLTIGQVVEQLSAEYPDITHSSLRFLEREGLIAPDRTAGGHRLFPPEQVDRIRTIKSWQRQRLSLEEIRSRLQSADQLPDVGALAQQFLRQLVSGDHIAARELIMAADDVGIPLVSIFDGIIRPVLHETGDLWERGVMTVGQEKEISSLSHELIALLSTRHRGEVPAGRPSIIAGCVDGEFHELGLEMLIAVLRERGYLVHYLGPSVAANFLVERVVARRPAAVILTAVQSERQPALLATLEALRAIDVPEYRPAILIGGSGVPPPSEIPDHLDVTVVQGASLRAVADRIESLIHPHPDHNNTG